MIMCFWYIYSSIGQLCSRRRHYRFDNGNGNVSFTKSSAFFKKSCRGVGQRHWSRTLDRGGRHSETPFSPKHCNRNYTFGTTGPLLVPHMSSEDCTIGGYNVPRQTTVFFNVWSIQRDPQLWDDPTRFKPERFESGDNGQYRLMSFGLERRACPGANMALRVMNVALGSLIQCFEWKRVSEELADRTEGNRMTMPKVVPLEAMCKPREIMARVVN
ncbi:uncharacterized protein J3R85_018124 [Psidium guajava]|nr:uncharacterized protein J3R85_018124 [Psidium guajava]